MSDRDPTSAHIALLVANTPSFYIFPGSFAWDDHFEISKSWLYISSENIQQCTTTQESINSFLFPLRSLAPSRPEVIYSYWISEEGETFPQMSGFNQLQIPPIYRGIRPHDGRAGSNTVYMRWTGCTALQCMWLKVDQTGWLERGVSWAAIWRVGRCNLGSACSRTPPSHLVPYQPTCSILLHFHNQNLVLKTTPIASLNSASLSACLCPTRLICQSKESSVQLDAIQYNQSKVAKKCDNLCRLKR